MNNDEGGRSTCEMSETHAHQPSSKKKKGNKQKRRKNGGDGNNRRFDLIVKITRVELTDDYGTRRLHQDHQDQVGQIQTQISAR